MHCTCASSPLPCCCLHLDAGGPMNLMLRRPTHTQINLIRQLWTAQPCGVVHLLLNWAADGNLGRSTLGPFLNLALRLQRCSSGRGVSAVVSMSCPAAKGMSSDRCCRCGLGHLMVPSSVMLRGGFDFEFGKWGIRIPVPFVLLLWRLVTTGCSTTRCCTVAA